MLSPLLTRSTFSPSIIKVQKATVRFSQAAYYTGTTAICLDVWHTECSHRKKKKKKRPAKHEHSYFNVCSIIVLFYLL